MQNIGAFCNICILQYILMDEDDIRYHVFSWFLMVYILAVSGKFGRGNREWNSRPTFRRTGKNLTSSLSSLPHNTYNVVLIFT